MGAEQVKYKQKWWDTWSTGMHSSSPCCSCSLSALGNVSQSVQLRSAPIKGFCKQKRLHWLLGVSYSSTPELLRRTLALKMANEKIYVFLSHQLYFLGMWLTARQELH